MISVSHEISRNLLYIMSERVRYSNIVIADSLEMQRKYQRYAMTDALTGLHNRGWLDDAFDREVKRSERDQLPLSLIMIDVDNFKKYNDDYGHLAGDHVLTAAARSIRSPLRPNDLVARFGGEEFAVLLPNTDKEGALRAMKKVKARVGQITCDVNGQSIPIPTFSAGLAVYNEGETLGAYIERADQAMYRAKSLGRDRVEFDNG
ncbi:MAG: GGDEF domain-containing protein, partial [Gammaproteobacteria bacterium]|nr:GGDEF domain-containing protein [Gammaproteobacteria bacterium]